MNVNIGGVISVALFYCLILAVGIWVGWKQKRKFERMRVVSGANRSENIMLAGRDMGLFVGVLTMTATWVAGGYINGTCESAFTGGFLKCSTMAFGYSMSLLLGGMFFAKPMRMAHKGRGYVTMLDPFQEKYGSRVGGLLFLPALCGEIFWSAAILSALGSIFTVMLGLDNTLSIIISAAVAVTYTLFGGLYSVAYTDVIQLACVLFGLLFCIPFVWTHPAVDHEAMSQVDWLGTIPLSSVGSYVDIYLLIILGGIPWQVYFQRVLACRSPQQAQYLSYIAAFGCLILAVPPAILGSVARVTDWKNGTEYGQDITTPEEIKSILPLILQYLTPKWVSFIGLGAVSAAIMSSADSTVLSTSSMFVHNIYKTVFFPKSSEHHLVHVMWVSIVVSAGLGTVMAITVNTIYGLTYLCADVVYVVLFPQLLLVIYAGDYTNTYGCITAFVTGFTLRVLSGEQLLNLPAVLKFPFYDEETLEQRFPFRTFLMLASIVLQLIVSAVAKNVFVQGYLSPKYDVFKCFDSNSSIIVAIDSKLNSGDAKDIDEETFFLNDSQPIPLRQSSK
ncbi:high-affinity choline transporter 1 isoform X1 [Daphnia magna]|uniref:high-affinity choline transporter 1 isoform X1 n=2 Tax=Daphnia magna TaxID=35525 RepID=UPI001E1BA39A|nr:high-affinity choline transporter 1 isoform X1 [Daphnia magna]XP_045023209.1 high-affinity choline transporter 1 isoform X1 [Daphnia magna]XP_045023210.1 high-affinity choline transporter 1 isoform X1 [Daphnia magna]XP_045023218.1 high-affinity choline transporter 1 isoform X1 [Daphnia magna]